MNVSKDTLSHTILLNSQYYLNDNLNHLSPLRKIYCSKGLYFLAGGSVKGLYFDGIWVCIGCVFQSQWVCMDTWEPCQPILLNYHVVGPFALRIYTYPKQPNLDFQNFFKFKIKHCKSMVLNALLVYQNKGLKNYICTLIDASYKLDTTST